MTDTLDHWRTLAKDTSERLQMTDKQLHDTRAAADELRARLNKQKGRLENAQERINDLQMKLIAVSAERDAMREQLADQEILKRKVYDFRESLLHGPIWEVFAELCRERVGTAVSADQGVTP